VSSGKEDIVQKFSSALSNSHPPIIFLRIGWMDHYCGWEGGDDIEGGGAFVKEHDYGHEVFNFQHYEEQMYGFVYPPSGGRPGWPRININRLTATDADNYVSGILAIWVAKRPDRNESYIVGWYANATVYREWQEPPLDSGRHLLGKKFSADIRYPQISKKCGYYITAARSDAVLLPPDERCFEVPRGKGGMGQANVWYADKPEHRQFRRNVLHYIESRKLPAVG
jgi:hypothetical protein